MDNNLLNATNAEDLFDEEWTFDEMIRRHKLLMKNFQRGDRPDLLKRANFSWLLKQTYSIVEKSTKKTDKDAVENLKTVMSMLKEDRIKPSYHDWCILFKIQWHPGDFYDSMYHVAGSRSMRMIHSWRQKHPRDINMVMAAVFTGYESELFAGYEQLYYSLANSRGGRHPYFKENSIVLGDIRLPYHVVYAAICRELSGSIYTHTGPREWGRVGSGMLGFPRAWSCYTWERFASEYKTLFARFRSEHGRELEATDILVSYLTQPNRYHGLKLMDPEECPVLKSWMEALSESYKATLQYHKQAQWVRMDEDEIQEGGTSIANTSPLQEE